MSKIRKVDMADKNTTRGSILEAVVTCIEKYGIDKITTRKIADEAGTNIASINYYFRSKDELVAEALSMTITHMTEDIFGAIDDTEQPFEQVLQDVIFYMLDGSLRYPGITTAHLYRAVTEKQYDSISARSIIKVFERLVKRAIHEYPQRDSGELRFHLSQIFSSIMFTMLAPNFFSVGQGYKLVNPRSAKSMASSYTKLFLSAG